MDILADRHLVVTRKLSSFFGIWYTQTFRERVIRNCILGFIFLYLVFAELCHLITMDFSLGSIVSTLQIFIPLACITSVYCVFVVHFHTYQQIFSWLIYDCHQIKHESELKIMQKYINECKLFAMISGCLAYLFLSFCVFPLFLQAVTSAKDTVVYSKYQDSVLAFFNNIPKRMTHYPLAVFSEIIIAFAVGTVAIILYSLYFWFIQHTCARLCITKNKIQNLFENYEYDNRTLKKPLDLSNWTIEIIQHLSRTRQFIAMVNKISDKCYLFNISLGFLLMVLDFLCGLQLTFKLPMEIFHLFSSHIPISIQHKETRNDTLALLVFIFDTIFPLYLNCFVGQRLMDYSSDVYEEMCLIPIHKISLKTQKLLLTTLMMNTRPCSISIGKMFVSSHEFFGELVRMSFSFAIMLHSTGNI